MGWNDRSESANLYFKYGLKYGFLKHIYCNKYDCLIDWVRSIMDVNEILFDYCVSDGLEALNIDMIIWYKAKITTDAEIERFAKRVGEIMIDMSYCSKYTMESFGILARLVAIGAIPSVDISSSPSSCSIVTKRRRL